MWLLPDQRRLEIHCARAGPSVLVDLHNRLYSRDPGYHLTGAYHLRQSSTCNGSSHVQCQLDRRRNCNQCLKVYYDISSSNSSSLHCSQNCGVTSFMVGTSTLTSPTCFRSLVSWCSIDHVITF